MADSRQKTSFPFKKIEALIKLAVEYDLEAIKVDDIHIVPRKRLVSPAVRLSSNEDAKRISPSEMEPMSKKDGKPLNQRQLEDFILFGPDGVNYDS